MIVAPGNNRLNSMAPSMEVAQARNMTLGEVLAAYGVQATEPTGSITRRMRADAVMATLAGVTEQSVRRYLTSPREVERATRMWHHGLRLTGRIVEQAGEQGCPRRPHFDIRTQPITVHVLDNPRAVALRGVASAAAGREQRLLPGLQRYALQATAPAGQRRTFASSLARQVLPQRSGRLEHQRTLQRALTPYTSPLAAITFSSGEDNTPVTIAHPNAPILPRTHLQPVYDPLFRGPGGSLGLADNIHRAVMGYPHAVLPLDMPLRQVVGHALEPARQQYEAQQIHAEVVVSSALKELPRTLGFQTQ